MIACSPFCREVSPTAKFGFWVDLQLSEDLRRRCELWNAVDKYA
jgi:hypothetical protein